MNQGYLYSFILLYSVWGICKKLQFLIHIIPAGPIFVFGTWLMALTSFRKSVMSGEHWRKLWYLRFKYDAGLSATVCEIIWLYALIPWSVMYVATVQAIQRHPHFARLKVCRWKFPVMQYLDLPPPSICRQELRWARVALRGRFSMSVCTVIPRLTSDPANEFFGQRRFFSLFFGLG